MVQPADKPIRVALSAPLSKGPLRVAPPVKASPELSTHAPFAPALALVSDPSGTDDGPVLVEAVIVARDRARADVRLRADRGVAEVGQAHVVAAPGGHARHLVEPKDAAGAGAHMDEVGLDVVLDIENQRFVLREKLSAVSIDELQSLTGAELVIPGDVADLVAPEV